MSIAMEPYDVIVVGAGNAALAAAVSARENGAERVLVLEKAPEPMRGGNTHWSGGVLRIAFDDPHELAPLLPNVERDYENFYAGIAPYTFDDYHGDLLRVTEKIIREGGHISIGIGDYPYAEHGAPSNAELIRTVRQQAEAFGREVASVADTREILAMH